MTDTPTKSALMDAIRMLAEESPALTPEDIGERLVSLWWTTSGRDEDLAEAVAEFVREDRRLRAAHHTVARAVLRQPLPKFYDAGKGLK